MTSAPLPDAGSNWVDRHAPEGLKPWLKLGRLDRPIGTWLLLLPGWQGIALALAQYRHAPGLYDLWLFVGFGIGAVLMRSAGCAFNDIVDRKIDAQVARTALRPIPAGLISVRQALAFVIGCSLISLLILLTLPIPAIILGFGSLILVAAYPFMKRITWWPQAWLGLTFNWGALMGYAAAVAAVRSIPSIDGGITPITSCFGPDAIAGASVALYIGGIFWTLGYDTIYALQDIEDDAMVGVKSSARRLASAVQPGVAAFYGLAAAFAGAAGLAAGLGPLFFLGLALYAAHLIRQIVRIDRNDPARALVLFRSNREAGFILLAAIVLGSIGLSS
ncbi:UbiA family prenyltransferase [Brevundimonas sp.]|uniref:UbiA family prenyltransferase n=1 Tax=Brevundimonas sp. TaxID=1871086 RepID=UPI0025BF00BB|nr:UbiA family prenyltransferase [Brevundimonas sp.]